MIEIQPISNIDASIEVPGSKSLTQRALIAASLAKGTSTLLGPLENIHLVLSCKWELPWIKAQSGWYMVRVV